MIKLLFYSKTKLKKNIEFKKIGIKIRNLNDLEKNTIIRRYKNIILTKKYKELAKKYKEIRDSKEVKDKKAREDIYLQLIELEKSNKFKYDVIFNIYLDIIPDKFDKLNSTYIKKYINNILIIEINDEEFQKQFDQRYSNVLIPKLIDFSNYLSTRDGEINRFDSFLFNYDMVEQIENKYHTKTLGLLLNESTKNNYIELNYIYKIEKMLNENDRNINFNFLMLIDTMFDDSNLIENQIVNKISFIERILIGKDSNKKENFTLKVGILCNDLIDINNDILSEQLKEIYNIRSLIVHGNSDKIIDNIEKYKNIFGSNIRKGKNKFETRLIILATADAILEIYFMHILKKYINNYKLCDYMKNN